MTFIVIILSFIVFLLISIIIVMGDSIPTTLVDRELTKELYVEEAQLN